MSDTKIIRTTRKSSYFVFVRPHISISTSALKMIFKRYKDPSQAHAYHCFEQHQQQAVLSARQPLPTHPALQPLSVRQAPLLLQLVTPHILHFPIQLDFWGLSRSPTPSSNWISVFFRGCGLEFPGSDFRGGGPKSGLNFSNRSPFFSITFPLPFWLWKLKV